MNHRQQGGQNFKQSDRKKGEAVLSIYDFDEEQAAELALLRFEEADQKWLNFVTQNRKNLYNGDKFDIVIGPVANDTTMPVLSDYMAGNISEEVALILLKPQKLADQYAFRRYENDLVRDGRRSGYVRRSPYRALQRCEAWQELSENI